MAISPMMQHYLQMKEKYKDSLLFYRIGDFYEMFYDDAVTASKELDLVLTGKDCGLEERAPMCGIPYHAVDNYIARLIAKGYKVAICDQLTEPIKGQMVDRDVTRIVTPGTVTDDLMLDEKSNNYIASVFVKGKSLGIAYIDITTGSFNALSYEGEDYLSKLNDELVRIKPAEIITNSEGVNVSKSLGAIIVNQLPKFYQYYDWAFSQSKAEEILKEHFKVQNLSMFDIDKMPTAISCCGALINYINETQKRSLDNIATINLVKDNYYMFLDGNARRNLELTETIREGKRKGSLIDLTKTTMGARLLKTYVEQPLQSSKEINLRLDAVDEIYSNLILKDALIDTLNNISDIERICGKIAYNSISPRDCLGLNNALLKLPKIKALLNNLKSNKLIELNNDIYDFSSLVTLLSNAINPDAPLLMKDGGYIKDGYNNELDEYRKANVEGKDWLAKLEATERQETGIKNLKIGYNSVFGYFIEVNKSQINEVPLRYIRKQTVANNERYITEELKDLENKILGAEENAIKLESKLFNEIKDKLKTYIPKLLLTAQSIATIDVLTCFASVAIKYNYVKPKINDKIKELNIVDGRHPVVEALLKNETFVPNDIDLNDNDSRIMIITGPNMAGKSTYMRQVALIVLLAHIGSFVPAKSATIPITDRIFTRVGASDDLAYGQSTFMVEMSEVSSILKNATDKSLIILDEVGRGTSTFDGLSIAWSTMEYISKHLKSKTLFATHYHELTELEGRLDGVKNYRISVKEMNGSIIFLRKIVRGGTNKSFGIEVASIAGLPNEVITRAKEILSILETSDINNRKTMNVISDDEVKSLTLTNNANEIIDELKNIDINSLSPIMALEELNNLIKKSKE
jgi:DNA mismatch repair protein MutS